MATNTRKRKQTTDNTAKAVSSIESTTSEISSALAEAVSTDELINSLPSIAELVKSIFEDFNTGCVPIPLEQIIETHKLPQVNTVNNFKLLLQNELFIHQDIIGAMISGNPCVKILVYNLIYLINFKEGKILSDGHIVFPIKGTTDDTIINLLIYSPTSIDFNSILLNYKLITFIKKKNGLPTLIHMNETHTNYQQYILGINQAIYDIISVYEINNILLTNMYKTLKIQLKHFRFAGSFTDREIIGFHGTNWNSVPSIITTGFNRSFSGQNGALLGFGTYFAVSNDYCINKGFAVPDENGIMTIIVSRVFIGKIILGRTGLRTPPIAEDGFMYDSTTNNLQNPQMYCIFRDYQACPIGLIRVKKKF